MTHTKYKISLQVLVLLYLHSITSAHLDLDHLGHLFETQNCIEATSLTLHENVKNVMLEKKVSGQSVTEILNITEPKLDKGVTSKLHELAQFNKLEQTYELISEEGPAHAKQFTVQLRLGDEVYEGSGTSLKKAKLAAASDALENTLYEHPAAKLEDKPILTPTVVLNNVAMKLGIAVSYELLTGKEGTDVTNYQEQTETEAYGKTKKSYLQKLNSSKPFIRIPTEDPQISGPFHVKVKVDDLEFVGFSHTVQAAKHEAAIRALTMIEQEALFKDNVCTKDDTIELCRQNKEKMKSPISRVYETGQLHKIPVDFNVIEETGKPHNRVFITECRLGELVTRGEGKSKKESKKSAAELMIANFDKLPQIYNGNAIVNNIGGKKNNKKKKKNNVMRKNVKFADKSVASMISSFFSSNDDKAPLPKKDKTRKKHDTTDSGPNKDKLLQISNLLNIEVQFTDLGNKGSKHFTLLSLGTNPLYICLGKAATQKEADEKASKYGLKLLGKSGLLDKMQWDKISTLDDFDFLSEIQVKPKEKQVPDVFTETE